jgi:hypothetical protein
MPRGGARKGTPGKGYLNRTDLAVDYSQGNAASGGMQQPQQAPQQQAPEQQAPEQQAPSSFIGADQVSNLGAPTMRPDEPVTTGLMSGMGRGIEALGPMPPGGSNPVRVAVQSLIAISPNNPDLIRLLNKIDSEGF